MAHLVITVITYNCDTNDYDDNSDDDVDADESKNWCQNGLNGLQEGVTGEKQAITVNMCLPSFLWQPAGNRPHFQQHKR